MMHAVDRSSSLARIKGLAVVWRFGLQGPVADMAEQRESKFEGEVEVCAKALQQRTRLISTARCPDPGLRHTFGLHPWIGDVRGE
jgi:hypothetical protein